MKQEKIQDLDLTPLAEEWFATQFGQFVDGKAERITYISFDVKRFIRFVINFVYEYQYKRKWGAVTTHTARIVGYDERSIRKFRRRTL